MELFSRTHCALEIYSSTCKGLKRKLTDKLNTGPGSGPLKTDLGQHFEMVQSLAGERGSESERDSAVMYGERRRKTPR